MANLFTIVYHDAYAPDIFNGLKYEVGTIHDQVVRSVPIESIIWTWQGMARDESEAIRKAIKEKSNF